MKGCVLEVDLEHLKELHEFHDDFPFAPDKIEIEREMLSNYQLTIANFYNIPTGNFFDKEKYVFHYENLQLYFRVGSNLKKRQCIRIQSVTMAKTICHI